MKTLLATAITFVALAGSAIAGRPIIISEIEACSGADLVVIATIADPEVIPTKDPFGDSEWTNYGFTHFAKAEVKQVLLGTPPKVLQIFGGKLGAGTAYRLEKGVFLILLTRVKHDAYRAVDWHYSFSPIKDGKVGWLADRIKEDRIWITPDDALQRIKANKSASEQAAPSNR